MKKVVLYSAFVSPMRSGAEACAEEVAARLQNRFDITIIAARMRRNLPVDDVLPTGVKVKRVGFGMTFDKWLYPFLAPSAAVVLQPDILHAVLESFAGMALVLSKRLLPKAKKILTCQSTNTSFLLDPMHRAADKITAISSVLIARANELGYNATLIPNGIRVKELQSAHAQRVPGRILFIGRLEKMKGVYVLISAFKDVAARHPDATLRIVGDGSQRQVLEQHAKDLGVSDRVTFVGAVPHDRVAEEYAAAEIFCGLSRSEALGNVFLEAQAAGCAVIGTTVGGIPDIVKDGETGLLVAPGSFAEAAGAIEQLLTDKALRERLATAGKAHAAAYDWDSIAERYGALYDELI